MESVEIEEAKRLTQEWRNGSVDARNQLILMHLKYAKIVASGLGRTNPHLYHELVSVGEMAIVQLIADRRYDQDDLVGVCVVSARNAMLNFLRKEKLRRTDELYPSVPARSQDHYDELVEYLADDEWERCICHGLAESLTYAEIALRCGRSAASVCRAVDKMRLRYYAKRRY